MKRQLYKSSAAIVVVALSAHAGVRSVGMQGVLRKVAKMIPEAAARRFSVESGWRRIAPIGAWQSPMLELGAINAPVTGRGDLRGLNGPELRRSEP